MAIKRNVYLKVAALIAVLTLVPIGGLLASQIVTVHHGVGLLAGASASVYVGDNATYEITVYNPSDFNLTNINVTDTLLGFKDTIPFMAQGNTSGVTYVLNRTVLCSDPNPLVNTIHVEAVDTEGVYSTASTQAVTTIKYYIQLDKTGPSFAHEGDAIKFTITVRNLADFAIANVTVIDELVGFSWKGDLSYGEVNEFNVTYVVPKGAPDPLVNTVVASAKLGDKTTCARDTWTVDILKPGIDVEKTVRPSIVWPNGTVTYKITVKNVGDAVLYNIFLNDSIYGPAPAELIPASLSPGESFTWIFNATIKKPTVNIANVTAFDILGKRVWDLDRAWVCVRPLIYPRSLGYWKNHEDWPIDDIKIGAKTYDDEHALEILKEANAKDATRMLAAQLIVAKLNRIMGTDPNFSWKNDKVNIDRVISAADEFLTNHPIGSNPQGELREKALMLKNILDAYNNSACTENESD